MFGPSKNHPISNLMWFSATKPLFIKVKHLLVHSLKLHKCSSLINETIEYI